jgi:uncharacterized repeat protein (TIGR01451 family)
MRIYQTLRKRGLALFLALIMCLSLVQVPAFAAEDDASEPADAPVMDVTGPGVQEPEAVPEEESPAPESEEIAAPDTQEEPEADEPEEYAPEYAAVEELEAAFEAAVEALEDGGVEGGIAALEEYLNIFDRLSPEDQEANQEAREAAGDYLQTLLDSLEGIEDEDVELLATFTRTIRVKFEGDKTGNGSDYKWTYSSTTAKLSVSEVGAACCPSGYSITAYKVNGSSRASSYSWKAANYDTVTLVLKANSGTTNPSGGQTNPGYGTGHHILVDVYKVVLDSSKPLGYQTPTRVTTLQITCKDGTTHSGYNHFTPLKQFHPTKVGLNTSGWVGYEFNGYYSGGSGNATFYDWVSSDVNASANVTGSGDYPCSKNFYLIYESHTHSYTQTVAPDCVSQGLKKCSGCGDVQSIPALGHSFPSTWVDDNSNNAHFDGCSSTGHKQVCIRCNGTLTGGTQTAVHTYGEWKTITEAKPGVPGEQKRTCTVSGCGHYETQPIAALPTTTDPGTNNGNFTVVKSFVGLGADVTGPKVNLTYEAWRTKDNVMVGEKESGTVSLSKNADGTYSGNITPTVWDIQTNGDGALSDAERARYKNVVVITENTESAKVDGYNWDSFTARYPADGTNDGTDTVNFTMDGATFEKTLSVKNTYTKNPQPESPNLTITKSADKDIVKVGETVKYTITVANTGKAAATNVVVSDTLPKGLEWVQDNDATYTKGVLSWTIGTIEAGGSASVSFTAKVIQRGTISNTASVTSDEIKTPVNSAPEDITGVKVSIKTTKSHSKITVDEKTGIATIPYTVTVKNTGDDLFGLDIIDKLTVKVTDQNGNPSTEPVKAKSITIATSHFYTGKVIYRQGGIVACTKNLSVNRQFQITANFYIVNT